MAFAIELSTRQSTRTLQQAVRHNAQVMLFARARVDDDPIPCKVVSIETPVGWRSRRACIVLSVDAQADPAPATANDDACLDLVGTYCDAALVLGENRYYFCSDVIAVRGGHEGEPPRLYLAQPETLQVGQRRRYWRFRPAQSSRVELAWTTLDESTSEGIGWLCNVSSDGLACRVDARVADQVGIGERLKLDFALTPGDPERFNLEAVLCNKTPAGTQGTTILGFEFLPKTDGQHPAPVTEALRRALLARYTPVVDSSGGVEP